MQHSPIHLSLPDWVTTEIDGDEVYTTDEQRMALAIRLARRNVELGTGGPFGAVIFSQDGRIVGLGVNRVVPQHCSVAHAEMMAFMNAQARVQRHRLNEDGARYILATSAQPCAMCYGASIWAGIDELLIGARSSDVEELTEFDEGPLPADWSGELERRGIRVQRDLLRGAAREVFVLYGEKNGLAY
ncbi:nucleoside deaminase [Pseudolysobacter antarcticus]|uniref:Nucleoside deaminase n=1 Tax=Pseudolysobacter antarcticus TaxID=2511995 RepID=A0A411HMA6_9GAMM|nr:nucleoside deaminase [Pseudolysobacter antarcticus]QBB71659.1 nucleoside deaminase [Pseudolysobacter antarcticus]